MLSLLPTSAASQWAYHLTVMVMVIEMVVGVEMLVGSCSGSGYSNGNNGNDRVAKSDRAVCMHV